MKIVEKSIFPFKVLYQCLNMIPIEIQFELNFKLLKYPYFSKLDQKQQKTCQSLRYLKFLQFFPKTLKLFQ